MHIEQAPVNQVMAGGTGFNLLVHVGNGFFKILRVIAFLIPVPVEISQFFTGFPVNRFVF